MARGFESKSVESQRQDAEAERVMRGRPKLESADDVERRRKRESLELSRRRIVHELDATNNDRRREQLRAALAHLDHELSRV